MSKSAPWRRATAGARLFARHDKRAVITGNCSKRARAERRFGNCTRSPEPAMAQQGITRDAFRPLPIDGANAVTRETADEPDEARALVAVLYRAYEDADRFARFVGSAREAGDPELALFFTECRDDAAQRAARARELLADRLDLSSEWEDIDGFVGGRAARAGLSESDGEPSKDRDPGGARKRTRRRGR
jgi:hypothetical protein